MNCEILLSNIMVETYNSHERKIMLSVIFSFRFENFYCERKKFQYMLIFQNLEVEKKMKEITVKRCEIFFYFFSI